MPTIDDIVKISGVSRSTVNRFLAGQTVRGDNAKKIKSAMKELNYRPDKIVEKRNCTIMIISASGEKRLSSFQGFAEMMIGIIHGLEEGGATVLMQSGSADCQYIPRVDGVIMFGLKSEKEDEIIESLKLRGIPYVLAYREINRSGVSYVTCDNYHAAYEMTEMLIKKGHKKIAVCGGGTVKRNMLEKLRGFKDCMAAYKLPVPSYLAYEDLDNGMNEWMDSILDGKTDFTAFFGLTDAFAIKFMEKAQGRGYKIPEDYAVVGMDGTAEAVYAKPKLTSVTIPFAEIGKKAAEAMFLLLDEPEILCVRKYLKYKITCRESD